MSLIYFLLVFSGLVLIHELGHFIAARLFGVKAEEFGFGFPPRAIGFVKEKGRWKRVNGKDQTSYKNTIWSLNWLPLGGFVRLKGEELDGVNDADSIHAKPIWQRIVIIAAGVIMNWVTAVVLFTIMLTIGMTAAIEDLPQGAHITNQAVAVTDILPGSAAEKAGIQPGDEIVKVDGAHATTADAMRAAIQSYGTRTFTIVLERDHTEQTVTVTPVFVKEINRPGLGVGLADVGNVSFPFPEALKNAVIMTWNATLGVLFAFGDIIKQLVFSRTVPQDVSGPVGIAVIAGKIAQQGISPFIQFAALLSVNLAVINFLPIPALDGGRALFLVIEKIRRRPISRKLEIGIHNVAFLLLILIIVLVTVRDVSRLHAF